MCGLSRDYFSVIAHRQITFKIHDSLVREEIERKGGQYLRTVWHCHASEVIC